MSKGTNLLVLVVLGIVSAACSGASPVPDPDQVVAQAEPTFTRTVVTMVNGKTVVDVSQITRAEQLAEQAAHEAQAKAQAAGVIEDTLTQATTCNHTPMIELWDGPTESGDEICFYNSSGTGDTYADLATYPRYTNPFTHITYYWFESSTNYVDSFVNGSQLGCFANGTGYQYSSTSDFYGLYASDYSYGTGSSITSFEYLVLGQYEWYPFTGSCPVG